MHIFELFDSLSAIIGEIAGLCGCDICKVFNDMHFGGMYIVFYGSIVAEF